MAAGSLRVIVGPTAAGKSALAMRLAERAGAVIVSADSRQLYAGFNIGTAKPSAADRSRVRHEGIDVADPAERWSAARWAAEASAWIDAAQARGQPVVVVGGTGFYVKALVEPLADAPALDPAARTALDAWLETLPTEELRRWVRALDPARAETGRTQLKRAAETALLTGRRLSDAFAAPAAVVRRSARYLVVDPGPVLAARIVERVDAMLAAGWVDEVRRLLAVVPASAAAWNACGYVAIRAHVTDGVPLAEVREQVIVATRQYAKRQRTWFRHQLPADAVTRLDPGARDADDAAWAWWHGQDEE